MIGLEKNQKQFVIYVLLRKCRALKDYLSREAYFQFRHLLLQEGRADSEPLVDDGREVTVVAIEDRRRDLWRWFLEGIEENLLI